MDNTVRRNIPVQAVARKDRSNRVNRMSFKAEILSAIVVAAGIAGVFNYKAHLPQKPAIQTKTTTPKAMRLPQPVQVPLPRPRPKHP